MDELLESVSHIIFENRYKITHKLGEGASSVVYAGESLKKDAEPVAIKILKSAGISHRVENIICFYNEAKVLSRFTHNRIIRLYKAGEENNLMYMILEYFRGVSMNNVCKSVGTLTLQKILTIMINLCEGLDYIHGKNIVHRDLKPGNILIRETAGGFDFNTLKIIDFGLSQIKEPVCTVKGELTGSLAYLAPEQNGLSVKTIDERSDLYALGAIFYELVTGCLPFTGNSIGAFIYRQMTSTPELPSNRNRDIPPILDKIILKLLEKEPEKRYQGALYLLRDLEKVRRGNVTFTPDAENSINQLHYKTLLVGRKEEYQDLIHIIGKAQRGKGSICFIKGEPGVGKSRLVEECRYLVYDKGGTFIEAKCYPGIKNIHLGLFKEALYYYTKIFFRYTREEKQAIRSSLIEKFSDSGRSIIQLCPPCAGIIGDFPPLLKFEPEKEETCLIHALSLFFLHLARLEGLLFLVLDDLQWLDASSIKILNAIVKAVDDYPFVIVCLYRDTEVNENSALRYFINNTAKQSNVFKEIKLKPFSPGETAAFIGQIFHTPIQDISLLSGIVYSMSKGNPFFIVEWLKSFCSRKTLFFRNDGWQINRQQLAGQEIPGNILAILLNRAVKADTQDLTILSLAAVIGKRFTEKFLCAMDKVAAGVPEARTAVISGAMERAVERQLIEEDLSEKGAFLFVHDRIRESFYNRTAKEDLLRLHDLAGRLWETDAPGAVFQIVYHYIKAHNKQKTLEYTFAAGLKAREDYASIAAAGYFQIHKLLLEQSGLYGTPGWITCLEHSGELCLVTGKNNKALKLYRQLLCYMEEDRSKANIYLKMSQAYFKKWDIALCEDCVKKGLALLGEKPVLDKKAVYLRIPLEIIKFIIYKLFAFVFSEDKKPGQAEKYRLILWFFYSLSKIYGLVDMPKFIHVVFYSLNLCIKNPGLLKEYGMYQGELGYVFMSVPLHNLAQRRLEHALEINEYLHDEWGKGQTLQLTGVHYQWKGDYGKSNIYLRQSLDIMRKVGDVKEMQYAVRNLRNNYRYLGLYEEAFNYILENQRLMIKADDYYAFADIAAASAVMNCETGNYSEAEKWLKKLEDSDLIGKNDTGLFEKYAFSGLLKFYKEETGPALEFFHAAYAIYKSHDFLMQYSVYIYIFLCDGYLAFYKQQQNNSCQAEISGILHKLAHFSRCAVKKTRAWPTYYGGALRVRAQYWAIKRKYRKAGILFKKSLAHSKSIGRKFELALGYYHYGYFLHESGKSADTLQNWYEAYTLFKEIGAKEFLKKVEAISGCTDDEDIFQRAGRQRKDEQMIFVIKEIGELLGADKPGAEVLDRILTICMELLGAQRGVILKRDTKSDDLEIFYDKSGGEDPINLDELSMGIINTVLHSGEPVVSTDALADEKMNQYQSVHMTGIRFVLCFPVKCSQAVRYLCYFDNLLTPVIIDKMQMDLLLSIMVMAAAFIENNFPARTDPEPLVSRRNKIDAFCKEYALTKREYTLLLYILQGLCNKEIMNRMNITHNTLHTHLNHIYRKTEAKSREELIKLFLGR